MVKVICEVYETNRASTPHLYVLALFTHLTLHILYISSSAHLNMVCGSSAESIAVLRDASAPSEHRLQAARHLKNIIVGQDQRKELAVKDGIVQPLADLLAAAPKTAGKRRTESQGVPLNQIPDWTPDDELRLQATLIIGSLAAAGPTFLHPLCAANIPFFLVDTMSIDHGEVDSRLIAAALHALKSIALFCSTAEEPLVEYDFWSAVINGSTLSNMDRILKTGDKDQVRLIAEIISVIPGDREREKHKSWITTCGVLDTLTSLLVSHAVSSRLLHYSGNASQLPPPPPDAVLPCVLAAIAATIDGSNYRAQRFILAPAVRDLFTRSGNDSNDYRQQFGARQGFMNSYESLLPPLHIPTNKTISHNPGSTNFPALKTLQNGKNGQSQLNGAPLIGDIDHSNAVCGWLIVLVRSVSGLHRVIALRLLAVVASAIEVDPAGPSHRTEFLQKTRERQRQLALLAVAPAVQLIKDINDATISDNTKSQKEARLIKEQACAVLALLVSCHKDLQVAAVELGAIKQVCPVLKKSFDNVTLAKPMWSAKSSVPSDPNAPATYHMGSPTFPPEISHAMRCREGALKALGALAAKEDVHRKAIIDSGVVSHITDSLKPFAPNAAADALSQRTPVAPKDGNTVPVIIAACHAAVSMSRSVSVLRTSLIDGGIVKPLIQLLHHPSLDVQIAATDACCNLLPEFSPMREDLSEGNVIKTLAEHARSNSPALRLSSIWALKHLVHGCPRDVRLSALEELGTGWLVSIIQGEQREAAPSGGGVSVGSAGLSTPNAAGEQVDLLNPSSMDVDEPSAPHDAMDDDDDDGELLYDEASSTQYRSSSIRSTFNSPTPAFNSKRYLSSIREREESDEYTLRKNEAEIQKQALDFVRNFIHGDDCEYLSDHLMNQIGSAKVYDLLTAKLSPLPRSVLSGKSQLYNTSELVLSTIHVIIHLANASAKHRQMLIAQKPLLQALLPHFNHPDHRIRVMCVWAVNSLTWIEEGDDRMDAHARFRELRQLGIESAVRGLVNDANLDVKERVKTAVRQFDTL